MGGWGLCLSLRRLASRRRGGRVEDSASIMQSEGGVEVCCPSSSNCSSVTMFGPCSDGKGDVHGRCPNTNSYGVAFVVSWTSVFMASEKTQDKPCKWLIQNACCVNVNTYSC